MPELNDTASNERLLQQQYSKKILRKLQSDVCSKLRCSVCPEYRCTSLGMYDEHLKSKKHLRKKFRKDSTSVWHCKACEITLPNNEEWVKHLAGQRHDKKLRTLSLQMNPTSELITPTEVALLDNSFEEEEEG